MGLNKILENMLTKFGEEYSLRSWSIFDEENGCVSVRIKFDANRSSVKREAIGYKRKPQSQLRRDKNRSEQWRHKQPSPQAGTDRQQPQHAESSRQVDKSSEPADGESTKRSGMVTRNQAKQPVDTPETPRSSHVNCDIPTDYSPPLNLDPKAPIFISSPPCAISALSPPLPVKDMLCDSESDSDAGSTASDAIITGCDRAYCTYGCGSTHDDTVTGIYRCTKCITCNICEQCLGEGGHGKHKKYLIQLEVP